MKSRLHRKSIRLRKDQAGYALMWVLVVIILAGIILVPLLLLMTAGLTTLCRPSPQSATRFEDSKHYLTILDSMLSNKI